MSYLWDYVSRGGGWEGAWRRGRKVERREEENRLLCLSEYKDILHRAIAITAISRY